ncbi:hypothetical protein [Pleomorphochaeta sp. DL1XJH-081]|uniref:hypothetical protein n=1 Tax=Pleomorphochaeta sp. DL1XJH-081 TaxID=3409690 RepID=UPI003BB6F1B1
MRKFTMLIFGLVILATILLAGCEESSNTTTLKLRFLPVEARSSSTRDPVSPDGQGLSITSYIITGRGPNDKSFTITTSSAQAEINGLVIGTWQIDVVGMNQQETILATGSASHHLTTKDNAVEVFLDEYEGEGAVAIDFTWGDPEFTSISLDLELRPQGGEQFDVYEGKTIDTANASARYEAVLQTGSYDLIFTLYSANIKIGGGVVALRILDGMTSSRTISIIVDKVTPEATGLQIISRVADPVVGEIQGISNEILPNEMVTARFVHSGGGGSTPLCVDWYLDGSNIATGETAEFSTFTGPHRLDVVAQTDSLGSVGSETFPFRATVDPLRGVPRTVEIIVDGETDMFNTPYWLTGVTDTAFLRDGSLLIASSQGLQVCQIEKDQLIVKESFIASDISDIAVDTLDDIICTTARSTGKVEFFQYNPAEYSLSKIASLKPTSGTYVWTEDITNVVLDTIANRFYFVDYVVDGEWPGSYINQSAYGPGGVTETMRRNPLQGMDSTIPKPDKLIINESGTKLAVSSPAVRSFYSFIINTNYSIWEDAVYQEEKENLQGPFEMAYTGERIQSIMGDGIHIYSHSADNNSWIESGKARNTDDVVTSMVFDPIDQVGWAVHGGIAPSVYLLGLINESSVYSLNEHNPMDCGSYVASDISLSPKGNFLSISMSNELRLLRISDG